MKRLPEWRGAKIRVKLDTGPLPSWGERSEMPIVIGNSSPDEAFRYNTGRADGTNGDRYWERPPSQGTKVPSLISMDNVNIATPRAILIPQIK